MKFDKHIPTDRLKPYVTCFVISENEVQSEYKVLPTTGLVIGFQYRGQLAVTTGGRETNLASAGVTGISDHFKIFKSSPGIGTVLVYFTEIGFTQFTSHPANELFDLSISLDTLFKASTVARVEERLSQATTDKQRVDVVEQFLLSELRDRETDQLIVEAVRLICQSNGTIRIKELNEKLYISQSPFEKRFRKVVGTTPKKFASIVRFNSVLGSLDGTKSLSDICYENNFFDPAHFSKDFKRFTGDSPENYKRSV